MNSVEEVDVVIVGGGVSGLSAAYKLLKNDPHLDIVVLEAKDRLGGRTFAKELRAAKGTDVWDLGGQWIGRCQPHVMRMVSELGLEVYDQYTDGRKVQQLGGNSIKTYRSTIPSMSVIALLDLHLFMKKVEWQRKLVPVTDPSKCPYADVWDSVTCDSMLRRYMWTKAGRQAIESAVRCMFGAEISNASWLYFLHYCNAAGGLEPLITADNDNCGQEYKIKGGSYQIANLLGERVGGKRIHLNTPVHTVEQGEKWVRVLTTTGHEFRCRRVILATPPHQAAKIHFEPSLPSEKQLVLNRTQVGHLIKIIITYKTAFWRDDGFSGEVVSNGGPPKVAGTTSGPLCIAYDATTSNGNPALVGFIGGEQQIEHSKLDPEERKKAVLAAYADYFGPKIHDYLEYAEKNWNTEPYSGGCPVSMCQPGVMRYMHPGLRLPFERIHFAGTESATVWCGFINGAIQSGYRAANEVLYNLRPQSIATEDLRDTCYAAVPNIKLKKKVRPKHVFRFTLGIGVACVLLVVAKKTYFRMLVG